MTNLSNSAGHRDVIAQRITSDGRAVTYLSTALIPGKPPRLWGILAETGGEADRGAAFIRLGLRGGHDGWSVTQLIMMAQARFAVEYARSGAPDSETTFLRLGDALSLYHEPLTTNAILPVTFEPGDEVSSYPWTRARAGLFSIDMCPDVSGHGTGVTAEQLLAALDLALTAWLPVTPWRRRCWETRRLIREALTLEAQRVLGVKG
jgi:hypothetical protein